MSKWFQSYGGSRVDLIDPQPIDIKLFDIAVQLSHINRFNGATNVPFSVAAHSIMTAKVAKVLGYSAKVQLYAILHDAHEYATGDIITPMKQSLGDTSSLSEIQDRFDIVIWQSVGFGLIPLPFAGEKQVVKQIDIAQAYEEATKFLHKGPRPDWDLQRSSDRLLVKAIQDQIWMMPSHEYHGKLAAAEFYKVCSVLVDQTVAEIKEKKASFIK